jgi:hypothetical protein
VRNVFGGRSTSYENELGSGVAAALEELEAQGAALNAEPRRSPDGGRVMVVPPFDRCFASSAGGAIEQERHGRSPTG